MFDLAIVGGGPAGLATAISAAQAGLRATVLDGRTLPLDKPCGEGLMPSAVAALAAMRVHVAPSDCAPFIGIRYVDGDVVAEGRFAAPAWGVRRTALVDGMATRARALGAELRYGCAVDAWRPLSDGVEVMTAAGALRARLLVAADGLHSRVRRAAGLDRPRRGRPRYGVRRHYRVPPWSPFVEVHWQERAEAYVTPAGAGRVGIAFLWDGDGTRFDDLLTRFPAVAARLDGAIPDSETRGAGPLRHAVVRRHTDRVALVGDAAGYLDALTGEGLTVAFESARALIDVVRAGRPLAAYETAYRRLSRTYYLTTELMLWIAAYPALRRRVVAALAHRPQLFDRVLALIAGNSPVTSLGVRGVVRLVHAVLAEGMTR